MRTINATHLRKSLYKTLAEVSSSGEPVDVAVNGRSVATIVRSPKASPISRKPLVDLDAIADLCKKHGIKSFALFGSILTDDFDAESDVDVLIDADHSLSLRQECDVVDDLERLFGRPVDLVERRSLPDMNRHRRASITNAAKEIYCAQ